MHCLVFYDVSDDRLRRKIADACLDFGMQHIQYSVFLGNMSRNRREELICRLATLLADQPGNIRIMPLCDTDLQASIELDETGYALRLLGG